MFVSVIHVIMKVAANNITALSMFRLSWGFQFGSLKGNELYIYYHYQQYDTRIAVAFCYAIFIHRHEQSSRNKCS